MLNIQWDTASQALLSKYFAGLSKDKHVKIAKLNKVLYQAGLLFSHVRLSEDWGEISRRRVVQLNEIVVFDKVASKLELKYAIIKTFRFPGYVPDDIDILIHPKDRYLIEELISRLRKHGYILRSIGTTELTLRKIFNGTYVDFDIHTCLGAGSYEYIPAKFVFENLSAVRVGDTYVSTPSKNCEFIISAAHAVMKEFEINLADILTVLNFSISTNVNEVIEKSEELGLTKSVHLFYKLSGYLTIYILSGMNVNMPYRISINSVLPIYISNLKKRIKRDGLQPMLEIFTFPRSKGIKKLTNILGSNILCTE